MLAAKVPLNVAISPMNCGIRFASVCHDLKSPNRNDRNTTDHAKPQAWEMHRTSLRTFELSSRVPEKCHDPKSPTRTDCDITEVYRALGLENTSDKSADLRTWFLGSGEAAPMCRTNRTIRWYLIQMRYQDSGSGFSDTCHDPKSPTRANRDITGYTEFRAPSQFVQVRPGPIVTQPEVHRA